MKMKFRKAAGPSGILAETISASGQKGVDLLTKFTQAIYKGVVPSDWQESVIRNLYKGKGDVMP